MPAFQYFTADRMRLVSPPSSNGLAIPLSNFPLNFHFASIFLASFCLFPVRFRLVFKLINKFFSSFSFRLDFFAFFSLIFSSFSLQILLFRFDVNSETNEIMPFFRFHAKRNFRFDFSFRFRRENEGTP
jgi:hypothetical protein